MKRDNRFTFKNVYLHNKPMKILFVLECANQPTNGTTASCIRFANELEKRKT